MNCHHLTRDESVCCPLFRSERAEQIAPCHGPNEFVEFASSRVSARDANDSPAVGNSGDGAPKTESPLKESGLSSTVRVAAHCEKGVGGGVEGIGDQCLASAAPEPASVYKMRTRTESPTVHVGSGVRADSGSNDNGYQAPSADFLNDFAGEITVTATTAMPMPITQHCPAQHSPAIDIAGAPSRVGNPGRRLGEPAPPPSFIERQLPELYVMPTPDGCDHCGEPATRECPCGKGLCASHFYDGEGNLAPGPDGFCSSCVDLIREQQMSEERCGVTQ